MSIGSSPPQTPPQLSPDGKWVWDGTQWQPVPVVIGDLAGVVPVVPAAAAPAVVQYAPPQAQAQAPVIFPSAQAQAPTLPYAVPEPAVVPLWEQQRAPSPLGGKSVYLFAGAAFVVLIMAMMALNSLNLVRLPWQSDGQVPLRPKVTPTPQLQIRTEFARAENFLKYSLTPALASFNDTLPAFQQQCSTTLSNSCLTALGETDQKTKAFIAVIDRADIPPCLAGTMTKVRADLDFMEKGLTLGLTGYKDNKSNLLTQGVNQFWSRGASLGANLKSLDQNLSTQCSTQQVGS